MRIQTHRSSPFKTAAAEQVSPVTRLCTGLYLELRAMRLRHQAAPSQLRRNFVSMGTGLCTGTYLELGAVRLGGQQPVGLRHKVAMAIYSAINNQAVQRLLPGARGRGARGPAACRSLPQASCG